MELSISVIIADRPYRLKIQEEQEETIRKAARMINTTMKELSGQYHHKDKQDLLAMAALQYAVEGVTARQSADTQSAGTLEIIEKIENLISAGL